jgi:polar amino acid transport system substrate-binding protein
MQSKNAFRLLCFMTLCITTMVSAKENTIKVGMDLTSPPFETIDTKGTPTGIGVEIAEKFCSWLGKDCSIVNIPFIGLIPSLQANKIDMILSSMTRTYKREKVIAFTDPYLSIGLCLLMSKKSSAQNAKDLNNKRYTIVVKTATTGALYATSLFPEANIRIVEQESSCISEVLQGKADAFFFDQLTVYSTWQKYPNDTKADLTPLVKEYWCVGVRQENTSVKDSFNTFIKQFAEKGGFAELQKKYLMNEETAFEKMGIPLIFAPATSKAP